MTISQREFSEVANRNRSGVKTRLPQRKLKLPPERHARKCVICRHPNRQEIETAFLHWRSPLQIASEYNLPSPRNIYRHAHAAGLYALRRMKLRCAIEMIVEQVDGVTPSADAVLRAIHARCHINDRGEWHEPPRHVIYTREPHEAISPSSAPHKTPAPQNSSNHDPEPQPAPEISPVEPNANAKVARSLEIEPGLNLEVSRQGVRLDSNRQFLVRLETSGNA
jgi:hypothetical protein